MGDGGRGTVEKCSSFLGAMGYESAAHNAEPREGEVETSLSFKSKAEEIVRALGYWEGREND